VSCLIKKRFFLLLAGITICLSAPAGDLIEIYQLARTTEPQLRAQVAAVEAAFEARPQARALFLPTVDISSRVDRNFQTLTPFFDPGAPLIPTNSADNADGAPRFEGNFAFYTYGYTLSLTQPLYRQENFARLKQADAAIAEAQANLVSEEQALAVRVAERYFNVLGAQDELTFARAEKEAIAQQLEQIRQRFEVGLDTIVDVNEAQAAYDLAVSQEINAENNLANAHEQLREVTGQYVRDLEGLQEDTPLLRPDPVDIDQWAETALQQNPQIDALEAAVENAREEIRGQRAGHYPRLDLVGVRAHNVQEGGFFPLEREEMLIGLQFNLPIFQGGAILSRTREAQHQLERALEQLEQARRQVFRQTREAYLGVVSEIGRVKALQQAIVSNESALEATEAGFEVGTRTTVEVLAVRRDLFRARRDHAQSRYKYLLDTLRLKQGAGIITLEDLARINEWLQ
jgi:outer membrane protein